MLLENLEGFIYAQGSARAQKRPKKRKDFGHSPVADLETRPKQELKAKADL